MKALHDHAVVQVRNRRYEPRFTLMHTTQHLLIQNTDADPWVASVDSLHSPASYVLAGQAEDFHEFARSEPQPVGLSCRLGRFADVRAWVAVVDHPYVTVTDGDGHFELPELPVGEWTFRAWHERIGWIKDVRRETTQGERKKEQWRNGRFTAAVKPGGTVIDRVVLRSKLFDQ